jgi:hypothetical protein
MKTSVKKNGKVVGVQIDKRKIVFIVGGVAVALALMIFLFASLKGPLVGKVYGTDGVVQTLTRCGPITQAGIYTIDGDNFNFASFSERTCISVGIDNVLITCNGNFVGPGNQNDFDASPTQVAIGINNVRTGVGGGVRVQGCSISDFINGVVVTDSVASAGTPSTRSIIIDGNTFSNVFSGVNILRSEGILVDDNKPINLVANGFGISVSGGSSQNVFSNNIINGGARGIWVFANAGEGNYFLRNTVSGSTVSSFEDLATGTVFRGLGNNFGVAVADTLLTQGQTCVTSNDRCGTGLLCESADGGFVCLRGIDQVAENGVCAHESECVGTNTCLFNNPADLTGTCTTVQTGPSIISRGSPCNPGSVICESGTICRSVNQGGICLLININIPSDGDACVHDLECAGDGVCLPIRTCSDTTPPTINNLATDVVSSSIIRVTLNTAAIDGASCQYDTNGGSVVYVNFVRTGTVGTHLHTADVSGLNVNTPYRFNVRCTDAAGNSVTAQTSFVTIPDPGVPLCGGVVCGPTQSCVNNVCVSPPSTARGSACTPSGVACVAGSSCRSVVVNNVQQYYCLAGINTISINGVCAHSLECAGDSVCVIAQGASSGTCQDLSGVSLGDVDGNTLIDGTDALLVLQEFVGLNNGRDNPLLTVEQRRRANVDSCQSGGQAIDGTDALYILERFVGLRNNFPCS